MCKGPLSATTFMTLFTLPFMYIIIEDGDPELSHVLLPLIGDALLPVHCGTDLQEDIGNRAGTGD